MAFVRAFNTDTGQWQTVPARRVDNPNSFGGAFVSAPPEPEAKKPKAPKAPLDSEGTADPSTPAATSAPATKE